MSDMLENNCFMFNTVDTINTENCVLSCDCSASGSLNMQRQVNWSVPLNFNEKKKAQCKEM